MDSERPVEKMLRAAAEKRRRDAGPVFEMHPATRRMLQGEVQRQLGPASTPQKPGRLLAALWLRLAGAAAVLTIVGVGFWVAWTSTQPPEQPMQLAKMKSDAGVAADKLELAKHFETERVLNEPLQSAKVEESRRLVASAPGSAMKPASAPTRQAEERFAAAGNLASQDAQTQNGNRATRSAETPVALTTAPALTLADETRLKQAPLLAARSVAPTTSPVPAAAPAVPAAPVPDATLGTESKIANAAGSTLAKATDQVEQDRYGTFARQKSGQIAPLEIAGIANTSRDREEQGRTQVFFNQLVQPQKEMILARQSGGAKRDLRTSSSGQAVLASFSVEQAGRELRVIDNDGSVYAGPVQVTNEQAMGEALNTTVTVRNYAAAPSSKGISGGSAGVALQEAPQFYSFHVTGTNRTLNQKVDFFGNLAQNIVTGDATNSLGLAFGLTNVPLQNQLQPGLQNQAVIFGKAVIDGKTEVNVNAQSAP